MAKNRPIGPRRLETDRDVTTTDVQALSTHLTIQTPGVSISVPPEELVKLLDPWTGRARVALSAMLRGYSKTMAATTAGVDPHTLDKWCDRDPEFSKAVQTALSWGFSTVIESEAYRRALAGTDDRGSARLLELLLKARSPEYREKSQLQLEVVTKAKQAMEGAFGGWDSPENASETRYDELEEA